MTRPPRRGRPADTRDTLPETPTVQTAATRCPVCGSTARSHYANTRTLDYAGQIDGRPYSRVVWRHCWCLDCGQHRIDKSYE